MLTTASTLAAACAAFLLYDYLSLRRSTVDDLKVLASVAAARSAAALMFTDTEASAYSSAPTVVVRRADLSAVASAKAGE